MDEKDAREAQEESPRKRSPWSYSISELLLATTFCALAVYSINEIVKTDAEDPVMLPTLIFAGSIGGFVGVFLRRNVWLACAIGASCYLILKLINVLIFDPAEAIIH